MSKNQQRSLIYLFYCLIPLQAGLFQPQTGLDYYPIQSKSGYLAVKVYDSYRYYQMTPILYSSYSFINNACDQFQIYNCDIPNICDIEEDQTILTEDYPFQTISGKKLNVQLSIPFLIKESNDIGYSDICDEQFSNNDETILNQEKSFGVIGFAQDNHFETSEFTIWMRELSGHDGFFINGWDDNFARISNLYHQVSVSSDWSFLVDEFEVGEHTIISENNKTKVYFDIQTPYTYIPENYFIKMLDSLQKYAPNDKINKEKNSKFYIETKLNVYKEFPDVKFGNITLFPYDYLRKDNEKGEKKTYQFMFASYGKQISNKFNGSIIIGSSIFKSQVGRFNRISKTVTFYKSNKWYSPFLTGEKATKLENFLVIIGLLVFFTIIFLLFKKCKLAKGGEQNLEIELQQSSKKEEENVQNGRDNSNNGSWIVLLCDCMKGEYNFNNQ